MNVDACCLHVHAHVHVKYMAQDSACIMYGILTSPPPVAAIHQSSFPWRGDGMPDCGCGMVGIWHYYQHWYWHWQ
jgi:hypothetical protein